MTEPTAEDAPRRLFLLDGHSLAYRAFFAPPWHLRLYIQLKLMSTNTGLIPFFARKLEPDWSIFAQRLARQRPAPLTRRFY